MWNIPNTIPITNTNGHRNTARIFISVESTPNMSFIMTPNVIPIPA